MGLLAVKTVAARCRVEGGVAVGAEQGAEGVDASDELGGGPSYVGRHFGAARAVDVCDLVIDGEQVPTDRLGGAPTPTIRPRRQLRRCWSR